MSDEEDVDAIYELTVAAPVNIALVKYWGKTDQVLILPFNDSISLSLDENHLGTRTKIRYSTNFDEDKINLNGKDIEISERLERVISEIRRAARKQAIKNRMAATELMRLSRYKFEIETENLMPTAAGLASSASGLASIAFGIATALRCQNKIDISPFARLGSGSACRSISGGLVQWYRGDPDGDGSDSIAKQIYPADHWENLCFIVLVVDANKKKIKSTVGMQTSLETSSFMKYRSEQVQERIKEVIWAFQAKCFESLAEVVMRDSNSLHAICQDTYPPINYLNDISHNLISFVTRFNSLQDSIKLAYTFDAGPNCFLLMEKENVGLISQLLRKCFLKDEKIRHGTTTTENNIPENYSEIIKEFESFKGEVSYAYETRVGNGARVIESPRLI